MRLHLSHLLLLSAIIATFALTVNADVQCLVNPCVKAAFDGICPREACKPDYSKGCDFKCSACAVTCANVLCIATTTCVHDPVNCRTECVPIDEPTGRACVQGGQVPPECPNDNHWDAKACKFVCNEKKTCTSNEGFPVAVGGRYFDKCNGCTCNADGTGTCTKKGCTDVCYDDLGNGFGVGATRKADCNTCTCQKAENGKGVWMCTLMACEPQVCVQGGPVPPECPNDNHWDSTQCKYICNQPNGVQCLVNPCDNAVRDGICPREACTPDYTKGCDFKCSACRSTCANVRCAAGTQCVHDPLNCQTQCKPVPPTCTSNEGNQVAVGESYFNKCNRCTCGADGVGSCTRRACLSTCYDDQGNGYGVGQSFKKDCNTCGCNKDRATGKGFWACTERACVTPPVQCLVNPCDQAVRDGVCPRRACTPDYSTGCDFQCTACRRTCANVRCPSGTECVHDGRNCYTECKPTGRVCAQGGPVPPECPNNNRWDSTLCKFVCN